MEEFEFFWNGPFSQWYPSKFEVHGMKFNCAEQFMMFCKAVVFNDFEIAKKVMKSNSPQEQKRLGRKVKGFDIGKWSGIAKNIVYVGNFSKYTQDLDLGLILENTEGKTLVEASPYDKIWGIGLAADNPAAQRRATWQGKNWLGEVLTQVREDLRYMCSDQEPFNLTADLVKKYRKQK